jgi:hypothetical protein
MITAQATMMDTRTKSYHKYREENDRFKLKEKLDYLKASVDVYYLLSSLGFEITHDSIRELRGPCKIHGGDNKTAFRFNRNKRTWACFTHKCHEVYGNDIIGLIMAVLNVDFKAAFDYLKQLVGDVGNDIDYVELKRKREMNEFINSYSSIILRPKSVNEKSLKLFKLLRSDFFIRHGFSKETLDYFEIAGGWKDKHNNQRDIIPIRSDGGELVAYALRDIRDEVDYDDKYIFTPGFDKENCFYNLDKAKHCIDEFPLIVVEGFKSVWRLFDYGINNVVAVMGSRITSGQQQLICRYATKGVVIMFDNDIAGIEGITSGCYALSGKVDVKPVFIQEVDADGRGLDPADLTKKQVYEYLRTYFKV